MACHGCGCLWSLIGCQKIRISKADKPADQKRDDTQGEGALVSRHMVQKRKSRACFNIERPGVDERCELTGSGQCLSAKRMAGAVQQVSTWRVWPQRGGITLTLHEILDFCFRIPGSSGVWRCESRDCRGRLTVTHE